MTHKFSEIPDDIKSKPALPLYNHLWPIFKKLGWEVYDDAAGRLGPLVYDLMKLRLDESINVCKAVMEGSLPEPEKTMVFMLHPPIVSTKTDLMQGTMKLLYGESMDCSFQIVNENTNEIFFVFNAHLEDGIPVDWWIVGIDDDIMERRHIKLGTKLRQIPKKAKDFTNSGIKTIEVLEDIRNERTPQWGTSAYIGAISWLCAAVNIIFETSCYESHGLFHDAVNAKRLFGQSDFLAGFTPWPPLLRTMFMMSRSNYILRAAGLFSNLQLFIVTLHEQSREWLKENFPEFFTIGFKEQQFDRGIPLPSQTIEVKIPDIKKSVKNDDFKDWDFKWPEGNFIQLEDMGLNTPEEALDGVLLDITHHNPPNTKVTPNNVVSRGMGKNTKFLK
ncbi:MAG: hypothetical protein EAX96_15165 [Candidatus Lokiarchaeota archaeon]|nr:hypothetical protein [Candidatus Lokiarchaeota archaeon]